MCARWPALTTRTTQARLRPIGRTFSTISSERLHFCSSSSRPGVSATSDIRGLACTRSIMRCQMVSMSRNACHARAAKHGMPETLWGVPWQAQSSPETLHLCRGANRLLQRKRTTVQTPPAKVHCSAVQRPGTASRPQRAHLPLPGDLLHYLVRAEDGLQVQPLALALEPLLNDVLRGRGTKAWGLWKPSNATSSSHATLQLVRARGVKAEAVSHCMHSCISSTCLQQPCVPGALLRSIPMWLDR